jgi:hypothetical protein
MKICFSRFSEPGQAMALLADKNRKTSGQQVVTLFTCQKTTARKSARKGTVFVSGKKKLEHDFDLIIKSITIFNFHLSVGFYTDSVNQ